MEAEEKMILRDLPVDTRNYTILDNVTGKPVDQNSYSLTIDPEVINKLNKLKRVTEEKIKQASLRSTYSDATLVETFTPEDNSVFSPLYEGEYIDAEDFNVTQLEEDTPEAIEEEVKEESPAFSPTKVIQQEGTLERVTVRETPVEPAEPQQAESAEEVSPENTPSGDSVVSEDIDETPIDTSITDNSTFNPENSNLQQASEQIVKIDAENLGPAIKPPKIEKEGKESISLDKMEIREGRGVAWLAYILFFIPLLFNRQNRYVRLSANNGLRLNLIELIGGILFSLQFFIKNVSDKVQIAITCCGIAGLAILGACAIMIIPMIIYTMFGGQFNMPWLWKKRMIRVKTTRD